MSTVLKNVLRFTGLVVNVPAVLPHGLNVNGIPVIPQLVLQGGAGGIQGGFLVAANAAIVTVTRLNTSSGPTLDVYVEHWHTIESLLPPTQLAGLVPFVAGATNGNNNPVAQVAIRLTDSQLGPLVAGSQSLAAYGNSSISLTWAVNNQAAIQHNIALQANVIGGTLRIRPLTAPDTEGGAIIVNNVDTGSFIASDTSIAVADFSTTSAAFVQIMSAVITPTAGSSLQYFATLGFSVIP